jgi:hypothetical protein
MGAQTQVVEETPVEEDWRVDVGTAVEIKDELAYGAALRRAQGP